MNPWPGLPVIPPDILQPCKITRKRIALSLLYAAEKQTLLFDPGILSLFNGGSEGPGYPGNN
jgi:hypothetical protein